MPLSKTKRYSTTTLACIFPDWPAAARVRACTTLRQGGVSLPPYQSLNLGMHTQDDPAAVVLNRQLVKQALNLPSEPIWLQQVHGTDVVKLKANAYNLVADASYTVEPGVVCAILTADCLPLLLVDQRGTRVAAIHAGWRSLVAGIIEQTVSRLECSSHQLMAWLGPAIGQAAFEVGPEVREQFLQQDIRAMQGFLPGIGERWHADLYTLARQRLQALGITAIYGGQWCTYTQPEKFFSYRRDGVNTGRMATLIWLQPERS